MLWQGSIRKQFLWSGIFSFSAAFFLSRVECFDKVRSEQCCQSVRLRWQSSVKTNLVAFNPKRMSNPWLQSWTYIVQVRRFDRCFPFLLVGRLHHGRLQQRGQYNTQQQVHVLIPRISENTFCRRVYRQIDGDSFLYYWDWGPNSGIHCFISITF